MGWKKNMAAITEGGVVGYVIRPQYLTSQVLLLTDRYASVDAIVQRTRSRGIVEGFTKEFCQLNYIKTESVEPGDLVVTSGLHNIFPKGFPIATVDKVEKTLFDVSPKVKLKPVVNPFNLEELFIIISSTKGVSASLVPQRLAPQRLAPQGITPLKLASQRLTPQKLASQRITPQKLASQRLSPRRLASSRVQILRRFDEESWRFGL